MDFVKHPQLWYLKIQKLILQAGFEEARKHMYTVDEGANFETVQPQEWHSSADGKDDDHWVEIPERLDTDAVRGGSRSRIPHCSDGQQCCEQQVQSRFGFTGCNGRRQS